MDIGLAGLEGEHGLCSNTAQSAGVKGKDSAPDAVDPQTEAQLSNGSKLYRLVKDFMGRVSLMST